MAQLRLYLVGLEFYFLSLISAIRDFRWVYFSLPVAIMYSLHETKACRTVVCSCVMVLLLPGRDSYSSVLVMRTVLRITSAARCVQCIIARTMCGAWASCSELCACRCAAGVSLSVGSLLKLGRSLFLEAWVNTCSRRTWQNVLFVWQLFQLVHVVGVPNGLCACFRFERS